MYINTELGLAITGVESITSIKLCDENSNYSIAITTLTDVIESAIFTSKKEDAMKMFIAVCSEISKLMTKQQV